MNKFDKANTPNEIIDIVDENDSVIGESTKDEAGYNPELIHRAVSILIHDGKGNAFVQKRSKRKEVYPNVWAMSCAGHVPKGQHPDVAALMELKEELGIKIDLNFVRKELREYPWETHFTYIYIGELPKGTKIKPNKYEVEEGYFMSFEEYKALERNGSRVSKYSDQLFREFFNGELFN